MPHDPTELRRVDRDKMPWSQLPVVVYTPPADPTRSEDRAGTVTVVRGDFDLGFLEPIDPDSYTFYDAVARHPGEEYVVFSNRIGQHLPVRVGADVEADVDMSRRGMQLAFDGGYGDVHTDLRAPKPGSTLADYADQLRDHASRMRHFAEELDEHAAEYDALAADGWTMVDGDLVDTSVDDRPDMSPGAHA